MKTIERTKGVEVGIRRESAIKSLLGKKHRSSTGPYLMVSQIAVAEFSRNRKNRNLH